MDGLTGDDGFALELETPTGSRYVKAFYAEDLPKMSPDKDPMLALGLLPALTPLEKWQELKWDPVDAAIFASKRVWVISKVSARLMGGLFTGSTSFKQLGGPSASPIWRARRPRWGGSHF
ncbi:hypothetical protein [Polynucleobacter necessarius]|uniref:hypothetical protein n=1 Tax=Polynucleobacter necessarius TaxID=576610 RepID=UPI001E5EF30C|nr:hypothetical protein [Polynucleobacter necessarius]